jgi:hypothetical protein
LAVSDEIVRLNLSLAFLRDLDLVGVVLVHFELAAQGYRKLGLGGTRNVPAVHLRGDGHADRLRGAAFGVKVKTSDRCSSPCRRR